MTNLEAYILKMHGKRITFEVASEVLGFDVMSAVNLVAVHIGLEIKYRTKRLGDDDLNYEYVLSRSSVNDTAIDFRELAHLLDLNLHLGVSND